MAQRVIRISDLATTKNKPGRLPVSPATVWRWVAEDRFVKPFKLGPNTTVWDLDQVEAFLAQQAAGGAEK
jgi:prophage regulatory protein